MSYDPHDLFTPEPKLLSLDCFPTVFIHPLLPPQYDLAMAANARYTQLSGVDTNRVSMESQAQSLSDGSVEESLLLLDPEREGDSIETTNVRRSPPRPKSKSKSKTPGKKSIKFSYPPTLIFRIIVVVLLIPSFVLLLISSQQRGATVGAVILISFVMVRNVLVILNHFISPTLRIRFSIELINRSAGSAKGKRECPGWTKEGLGHLVLDSVLLVLLCILVVLAHKIGGAWYWFNPFILPACVLAYVACGFYLFAMVDLGKPSNITTSGEIFFEFNYGKEKEDGIDQLPQLYKDIEASAAGGLGADDRKTSADSPVII